MDQTSESNKRLVLDAFDTLFNKRDYAAAEKFWPPGYIQHSAHIAPGREGLFNLIKSLPPTLKYEPGTIVADGDFVIVHGRFSNFGLPVNWIAADILRIQDGVLAEHWDVIEDEATRESSKSGLPMSGDKFARIRPILHPGGGLFPLEPAPCGNAWLAHRQRPSPTNRRLSTAGPKAPAQTVNRRGRSRPPPQPRGCR
jgi:predicted SnoaL-like aldol condensation-catalyzing enzyme